MPINMISLLTVPLIFFSKAAEPFKYQIRLQTYFNPLETACGCPRKRKRTRIAVLLEIRATTKLGQYWQFSTL